MTTKEVIGRNIKKYRKAAGHTQQDLGSKIGYSDSGISAFENGVNEVDMETLKKIADIYGVTVDDLLGDTSTPDFTISNLCITKSNINDVLDMLFPLVSNDTAIQNDSFKAAYNRHRKMYDQIKRGVGIVTEDLFKCYDIYVDAWNESGIIEAVVNMVGILFVVCSHITEYDAIKLQQKLNTFQKLESRQAKEIFDRTEKGIEDLANEKALFAEDFYIAKIECLRELKKSPDWAQLADYYIAYSYIINFTQNDNSIPQNMRIGRLLMEDYAQLGNHYCINFFRCAYSMYK